VNYFVRFNGFTVNTRLKFVSVYVCGGIQEFYFITRLFFNGKYVQLCCVLLNYCSERSIVESFMADG
jgi:hypothetical protein